MASRKFIKEFFVGFVSGHDVSRAGKFAKSNGLQPPEGHSPRRLRSVAPVAGVAAGRSRVLPWQNESEPLGVAPAKAPLNTSVKGKGTPHLTLDPEANVTGKSTARVAETLDLRGCPEMARSDPREHLVQIEFALMIALGSCGTTMSRRRSPRIEFAFSGSFPPKLRGSLCQAGWLPENADGPEGKCPDISSHPEAASPSRFRIVSPA